MHGDPARLSGIEVDAIECGERVNRKLGVARPTLRGIKVYLRNLVARRLTGVSHIEAYVEAAVSSARNLERGVVEAGIGHAVTKRIERLQVSIIVPPIANENAL